MDKNLLMAVLRDNVSMLEIMTGRAAEDDDYEVDGPSYMRGALAAYSIVFNSLVDGDYDAEFVDDEQQLLF